MRSENRAAGDAGASARDAGGLELGSGGEGEGGYLASREGGGLPRAVPPNLGIDGAIGTLHEPDDDIPVPGARCSLHAYGMP